MTRTSGSATLLEKAYRHIRAELANGRYAPGTQLSEASVAESMGIGRTPVREAFLLLQHDGFLEQVPRFGTFVRKLSRHEWETMFELREQLESHAAGKAALTMNAATVDRLEDLCDQTHAVVRTVRDNGNLATPELYDRAVLIDAGFHMLILHASRNPWVIKIVGDTHLMDRVWVDLRGAARPLAVWASTWREHTRICRAIRRKDAGAATYWMRVHLRHGAATALSMFDEQARAQAYGAPAETQELPPQVRETLQKLDLLGPPGQSPRG